ncbi:MAG: MinD/ParA family protein [Candidatus Sericytochromatia bacterium]|nr:MinD/ParA family protein [Candidatus Tanganyikabacteria bacterium]
MDQAARLRELVGSQPAAAAPLAAPPRSRILVVTSGKGGVGKTNLTVNLALALAARRRRVLLFDADMGMANVDVILNISPPYTITDVIAGRKGLWEIVFPVDPFLAVVPGGSGVAQLASLDAPVLSNTLAQLATLENAAELLLVDTGAGISPNVLGFVLAAPEVLVVTTPEPTAIVDAYGIIKTLDSRNPQARISLVVNMVESEQEARSVHAKVSGIIERFLTVRVGLLGWVEKDGNVGRSVLQQQPFLRAYPYSLASKRVNMLAASILAQDLSHAPVARESFFARLGKVLFK